MEETPNKPILHHVILKHVIEKGFAPDVPTLAEILKSPASEIEECLTELAADHGVVLHPNSHKIWVIHPFSLAPTNFWVQSGKRSWWGNCAWCSLGVAALLQEECTITSTLGAHERQVIVHIRDGRVSDEKLHVHFPIPMRHAWDNVVYTCSTMLFFESEEQVDAWCQQHDVKKGDVQPVTKVWELSKVWYGKHLSRDWKKWTAQEARRIFEQCGLTGPVWEIQDSDARF